MENKRGLTEGKQQHTRPPHARPASSQMHFLTHATILRCSGAWRCCAGVWPLTDAVLSRSSSRICVFKQTYCSAFSSCLKNLKARNAFVCPPSLSLALSLHRVGDLGEDYLCGLLGCTLLLSVSPPSLSLSPTVALCCIVLSQSSLPAVCSAVSRPGALPHPLDCPHSFFASALTMRKAGADPARSNPIPQHRGLVCCQDLFNNKRKPGDNVFHRLWSLFFS